eukprot:GHRQ01020330.1.p2 GENE.GHRQ01020330.1~~GHRQ01020330.1.p2  ORF type:complete len:141 (-),score=50.49 GHRQ01020330.1:71-493(-)
MGICTLRAPHLTLRKRIPNTRVCGWTRRALVQMLWAFARFGYQDEALLELMHDIALKLQAHCNSKSLADVVYAVAQLGWADSRLHSLVAEYAMDNIQVRTVNEDTAVCHSPCLRGIAGACNAVLPGATLLRQQGAATAKL